MKKNTHLVESEESSTIERKIGRMQQMVQSFHDRAKATSNDIKKQHYTDMANQLAGQLDDLINDYNEHERAGNDIARHDEEPSQVWEGEEEALAYATQAHAGQTRSGGDPYITHPMRVADHIRKYKQSHNLDALISAAYLHDTIEDTSTTQEALHDLFGGLVASLVQELTSDPAQIKKMGKKHYLAHKMAAMSSYGLVIKLADRLDNVKDITTAKTPEWRHKYAQETAHILDYIEKTRALSGTHRKLIELIRAKLAEIDNPPQVADEGITRRGILKGIGAAAAAGAAGKASAIAGAFPTPSQQQAMYKAAADSNRAMAAQEVERQRRENAARAAKLAQNTQDVERLNKVNYHGKDAPKPTNAEWDGDSDFLYLDGTQYAKASRMPISGDVPSDLTLVSTKEGRQVYLWTRRSLKGTQGHYFYPAEKPNTIDEDSNVAQPGQLVSIIKAPRILDLLPGESFEVRTSDPEGVTLKHGMGTKFDNVKFPHGTYKILDAQGIKEGPREQVDPNTVWEVCFDYGPHQSDKVKVRASSQEEAEQKGMRAAKKLGHRFPMLNWAMPAEQDVTEGSTGVSVRKWANQVRKDHGADVKFFNRKEGGGAVDSVVARNSQGETVGVYNRKTGYPTVYEPTQGLDEASFDKEAFRRQMRDLEAREELRKTDPVSAKALDLRDKLPQQTKKKPEDDSIGINDPRHPGAAYTQGNQLDEFDPGNGDDDRPTAEYEVYQCQLDDQFDWIGGPLMQTDRMDKAHSFAYFLWKKHPDKCFMIWQERSQGSRGGYGPEGSVLAPSKEIDEVSDKTLVSYLTKVDDDSRKHKMDPTKRSDKKASKSVSGFSKAFNKLDSRKPDGTISEDYLDE